MQIRSLAAGLLALALAAAAPVHAQATAADSTPSFRDPEMNLGMRMAHVLREAGLQPSGRVLLFMDGPGTRPRISFQLSNVPDSLHAAVLPLVDEYTAARADSAPLHLSFLLEGMTPRRPRTAEVTRERLPELRNPTQLRAYVTNVARTHPASRDGTVNATATVRVYVSEEGKPVLVEARPTGDPHIDLHLTNLGHAMEFRPARINRDPVGVWIEMPFQFHGGR
jgi:hypothetical protein